MAEPFISHRVACVYRSGSVAIIRQGIENPEFYVYSGDRLVRVCPSIGMAQEVAASL